MEALTGKNLPDRFVLSSLAAIFVLVQIPVLKIYDIKLVEMVGLIALAINIRKTTRADWYLIAYFSLFLILALALNPGRPFADATQPIAFKSPYMISVARYVEYLSIVGFVILVRHYVRRHGTRRVAKVFITTSLAVQAVILVGYLLEAANLETIDVAYMEDGFLRMKGFFVEGGPLGMFNAFVIIMLLLFVDARRRYFWGAFLLLFIVLGKSKAGLSAVAAWSCWTLLQHARRLVRTQRLVQVLRIAMIGAFLAIFYLLASVYVAGITDEEGLRTIIENDPTDFWINGGRIPGYFILKQMITAHPVLGIGMGNYPLLRNADRYRDFMPVTMLWDIHGYGGIVEILNQFGILGLVLFMVMMAAIFRPSRRNGALLLAFLIPFAFGLSLHFHYPWMILGMLDKGAESPTGPRETGAAQV